MKTKNYSITLDNKKIGTTKLEKADPSMGVVYGAISFLNMTLPYDFFKDYCNEKNIPLAFDYPEDQLISTTTLPCLHVTNGVGTEITHMENQITGIGGEEFEITLTGIPYPFYEEEFPEHLNRYNEQFEK